MKSKRKSRYLIWIIPTCCHDHDFFFFRADQGDESSSMSNIFVDLFLQVRGTLGLFPKFADADLVNVISIDGEKRGACDRIILLCTSFLDGILGIRKYGEMAKHRFFCIYFWVCMQRRVSSAVCTGESRAI